MQEPAPAMNFVERFESAIWPSSVLRFREIFPPVQLLGDPRHVNKGIIDIEVVCCEAKNDVASLSGRANRRLADWEGQDAFARAWCSARIHLQFIDVNFDHFPVSLTVLRSKYRPEKLVKKAPEAPEPAACARKVMPRRSSVPATCERRGLRAHMGGNSGTAETREAVGHHC